MTFQQATRSFCRLIVDYIKRDIASAISLFISFCRNANVELSVWKNGTLLFNTRCLTGKFAQIVEFSTTYFTPLVHLDRVNVG